MTLIDHPAAAGTLLRAGDPGWDDARRAFNLLVDQRPDAIALPQDEREVAAAVRWAVARGLRVAPQATGHNAAPLGDLAGTLLLNVSRLTAVEIDAGARRVRAGAGTRWRDVVPPLSALGLAALHGSSPDVGVVGYSLGGGIGWLARRHGLQCSHVTAVELVTADGDLVRADPGHEPELFWALRGGGGNFGVVTAIEFGVLPVASLHAGMLLFDAGRAEAVLRRWRDELPGLPDTLTTWASVLQVPDLPFAPAPLRGRSVAVVSGVLLGDAAGADALLAPLRELGPELDTFATVPPAAIADLAMDPPDPMPYLTAHRLLTGLDEDAIATARDAVAGGTTLGAVQLRHLGGALAEAPAGAGARATLPGQLAMFAAAVVPDPALAATARTELARVDAAFAPATAGHYPSFVEEPADAAGFFDAATWTRLRAAKALYDPRDVFRGNHHVAPAA